MKFRSWLKKQGEVVEAKKVLQFTANKTGEPYDTIRKEVTSSKVELIDVPVWDDEFYDG